MQTIHILVGIPRSSKTTYRRNVLKHIPCVCPDDIRLNVFNERFNPEHEKTVWALAWEMFQTILVYYNDVVIDATNITKDNRKFWMGEPLNTEARQFIAYYFDTPVDICIERAKSTNQEDLLPVIHRMANNFEMPTLEEGFKEVKIIT